MPPGQDPFGTNPFQQPGPWSQQDNPLTNPAMFVRAPAAPRRSPARQRVVHYATVTVVFILLVGCCGGVGYLVNDDDDAKKPAAGTATAASPSPTPTWSPRPTPTFSSRGLESPPPPVSAAPSKPSLDDVDKGDCLKNNGTNENPDMAPAPCAKGTYQVLARFYGTVIDTCHTVAGSTTSYTVTYYRNGIPDFSRSYVFCLKRR
jgi:hypothetical protein